MIMETVSGLIIRNDPQYILVYLQSMKCKDKYVIKNNWWKKSGYENHYDSKDKLLAAFETADKLRLEMDNVLQELVKSEALEEVDREPDTDIER